jgi:SAM-dependent methyltransferase
MKNLENYLTEYKDTFESQHVLMVPDNHQQHNPDPEYWNMLLGDVKFNPEKWKGKRAFDFGCGCGRNLYNLSTLADWAVIDGCDISKSNAEYAEKWYYDNTKTDAKCKTWESNGIDIQPVEEGYYDFIMSHIVLQHISNYSVRYNIICDMYKSLSDGGLCTLHFQDMSVSAKYYENCLDYKNCVVENEQFLVDDFEKIGFKNINVQTGKDYLTGRRVYYIKGEK